MVHSFEERTFAIRGTSYAAVTSRESVYYPDAATEVAEDTEKTKARRGANERYWSQV